MTWTDGFLEMGCFNNGWTICADCPSSSCFSLVPRLFCFHMFIPPFWSWLPPPKVIFSFSLTVISLSFGITSVLFLSTRKIPHLNLSPFTVLSYLELKWNEIIKPARRNAAAVKSFTWMENTSRTSMGWENLTYWLCM